MIDHFRVRLFFLTKEKPRRGIENSTKKTILGKYFEALLSECC
jgi:hypothetical protein